MFKYFILLLILFSCSSKENISDELLKNVQPEKNYLYLVYRKTDTKNGIIAQSYNQYGSSMSHIGLAFLNEQGEFNIYHVLKKKGKDVKNDFWCSDFKEFYSDKEESIIGAEIYKSNFSLNEEEILKIKKSVDSLKLSSIKFDFSFNFNDKKKMYCSEFVYFILHSIGVLKEPILCSKDIKGVHKAILGTSTLKYLPVDFLYSDKRFTKIYSKEFNSNE